MAARKALRDALLQSIGSSRYALLHRIVRRRVDVALDARLQDPVSADLDARWQTKLRTKALFATGHKRHPMCVGRLVDPG
jgi:type IV secretion system protein VirB4